MTTCKKDSSQDYVSVIYNQKDRPITKYPNQLTRYLTSRYAFEKDKSLLDIGCGRGDFLNGFIRCGLKGYGTDMSPAAREYCPEAEITQSDLENGPLPYGDEQFDYVFSKSLIEHFYYPEKLVKEIFRVLKPGGRVITMTPDWESVYKTFYLDFTHRTPFTKTSLKNILLINGFINVDVEKFRQLPFVWSLPWLHPLLGLLALFSPNALSPYSKLIKFSKEIMLLSCAVKPR